MSYLVLARKYRPQSFADVIGQEHITQTLANAIAANRLSHAILLAGPRGTGKTTMARLLAKSMNCAQGPTAAPCNECENCKAITAGYSADVLEIDGASNNGVDQVRELRENSKYMPAQSRYKVYIIDEVHMLSLAAFNALLKTLEEPPAHVLFFFATTERHKLPVTILSRCQRYDFRRVASESVAKHLAKLCRDEKVDIEPACLDIIARESGGSVRDAISLLDQVISTADGAVDMQHAIMALGITERRNVIDLASALLNHDAAQALELTAAVYDSGYDLKKLHQDLLEYFRDLLLVKLGQNAELIGGDLKILRGQAELADAVTLNYYMDILFRAESTMRYATSSRMAFETLLLRLLATPPTVSIETLIDKLDELSRTGGITNNIGGEQAPAAGLDTIAVTPASPAASGSAAADTAEALSAPAPDRPGFQDADTDCLPAVIRYLEDNGSSLVAAMIKNSELKPLAADKLLLEVKGRGGERLLKSEQYAQALNKAFKAVLGREVAVEYTCVRLENASDKESLEVRRAREQALVTHPVINDALEIFKGEVTGIDEIKSAK